MRKRKGEIVIERERVKERFNFNGPCTNPRAKYSVHGTYTRVVFPCNLCPLVKKAVMKIALCTPYTHSIFQQILPD